MEGYLYKKGRGDSSFGRRNWKKRWFVLERQNLMYYEELDLTTGIPVSLRDTINIAGCTCAHFKHHEKKHTFSIKLPGDTNEIILQTLDGRSMNAWIKEISAAARGENLFEEVDYPACYQVLGLSINDNPAPQDINRAYRKMALKCHPDKGGDMIEFKKVQDSFNNIMNKITSDENDKLFNIFEYEVVLLKSPGDAGLGLAVREDSTTKQIHIKDVLPDMKIQSISPVAGGGIKINDVLVAVRNENVRRMPLMRVAQKLNDFRVPVSSTVQLTFERRERKDGGDGKVGDQEDDNDDEDEDDEDEEEDEEEDDDEDDEDEEIDDAEDVEITKNEQKATEQASPPNLNIPRARTMSAMEDIDDDDPTPPPPAAPSSTSSTPSFRPKSIKRSPSNRSLRALSAHLDPVKYVSVMAENEELTAAMTEKETALQQMNQQQAKLQRKLAKYQQRLQHLSHVHREANDRLQQASLKQRVTKETLALSLQLVKTTAQRVTAQVAPSAEILQEVQPILAAEGLLDVDNNVPRNTVKAAQREAILAAASVDFSGHFGQRWAAPAPGESSALIKQLERFEQALQMKMNDGSAAEMLRPMRYAVPAQYSQPAAPTLASVAEEFIPSGEYGSAQSVVSMSSNASRPKVPVAPRTGSPVSSLGGSSPPQSAKFRKTTKSRENNLSQRGMATDSQ